MRRQAVAARMAGGRLDLLLRETFLREASRDRARKRRFKRPHRGPIEAASRISKQLLRRADGGDREDPHTPGVGIPGRHRWGRRVRRGTRSPQTGERSRSGARAMGCRSSDAVAVALRAVFAIRPEPAAIPSIDRERDRTPCKTRHSYLIHTQDKNQLN